MSVSTVTMVSNMEEIRFKKKYADLIQRLTKELHFSQKETEDILLMYHSLHKFGSDNSLGVTKSQFKDFLHSTLDMTDTEMCNRVIETVTKHLSPVVSMEAWARTLSLFLRGTLEEKTKYCYNVYDVMGYGKIGRDILVRFLDNCIISSGSDDDQEDAIIDMAEILAKKMDLDRDGNISIDDFRKVCKMNPALLEVLGPCLPTRLAIHSFLTFFTPNVQKY